MVPKIKEFTQPYHALFRGYLSPAGTYNSVPNIIASEWHHSVAFEMHQKVPIYLLLSASPLPLYFRKFSNRPDLQRRTFGVLPEKIFLPADAISIARSTVSKHGKVYGKRLIFISVGRATERYVGCCRLLPRATSKCNKVSTNDILIFVILHFSMLPSTPFDIAYCRTILLLNRQW